MFDINLIHKIRSTVTIFLAVALMSMGCQQSDELSETQRKNIIDTVTQTLRNYYSDMDKKGLLTEFNYLDSSKEFYWLPPGYSAAIDYNAVAAAIRANAADYKSIKIEWDTLSVDALSNKLARYTGRLRSKWTDTSGKSMNLSFVETGLLIKRDNGWKLLSGQTAVLAQ
jgi:hypothetical protein